MTMNSERNEQHLIDSRLNTFHGVARKVDSKGHHLIDTVMNIRDNNCPLILECNTLSENESFQRDKAYIETPLDDFSHLLQRMNTPIESDHIAPSDVVLRQAFSIFENEIAVISSKATRQENVRFLTCAYHDLSVPLWWHYGSEVVKEVLGETFGWKDGKADLNL